MTNSVVDTISQLPATSSVVYRGMSDTPPASSFTVAALLPTSADPRVASQNFTSDRVAAIVTVTGRSIAALSRRPQEQEVAILPGTLLLPVGNVDVPGLPEPVVLLAETGWAPGLPENKTKLEQAVIARISDALLSLRPKFTRRGGSRHHGHEED